MPKSAAWRKAKGHLHRIDICDGLRLGADRRSRLRLSSSPLPTSRKILYKPNWRDRSCTGSSHRERLLNDFYDFRGRALEAHRCTTNPIESTFATVQSLRTVKTKGCLSRKTALAIYHRPIKLHLECSKLSVGNVRKSSLDGLQINSPNSSCPRKSECRLKDRNQDNQTRRLNSLRQSNLARDGIARHSVASGDAQSLPLIQQLARGNPPRSDDVHRLPAHMGMAWCQATEMLDAGDMNGMAVWLRIVDAIKDMQRETPRPGEYQH